MSRPKASGPMLREYMREVLEDHRDSRTGEVNATQLAEDAIWHYDMDPQSPVEEHQCEMCFEWAEEIVRGDNCRRMGTMPGCVSGLINRPIARNCEGGTAMAEGVEQTAWATIHEQEELDAAGVSWATCDEILTDRAGHIALARAVLERGEVLRAIEWIEDDRGNEVCPSCQNWRIFGHDHDCALAKALRGDGNG